MIAWRRLCLLRQNPFTTMALQPQKRILRAEDEILSKKPRLVQDTAAPQAEASSSLEARHLDTAITGVPVADVRMAEDQMQTEKKKVNLLVGHGVLMNQSKGKKKKIRPPRVGRPSRNEEEDEDEERKGTLLSPMDEMEPTKALRLPKRQCALLLGFCGSGYRGMQM